MVRVSQGEERVEKVRKGIVGESSRNGIRGSARETAARIERCTSQRW